MQQELGPTLLLMEEIRQLIHHGNCYHGSYYCAMLFPSFHQNIEIFLEVQNGRFSLCHAGTRFEVENLHTLSYGELALLKEALIRLREEVVQRSLK